MARALADAFVRIRPDSSGFRAQVDAQLTAQLAGAGQTVLITANTQAALAKMAALRGQMTDLSRKVTSARLVGDDKQLQLMLAKLQVQLQELEKKTTAKTVTLVGADKVETQLMGLTIAADKWIAETMDKTVHLDTADAQTRLAYLIAAGSDLSRKAYEARVGLTGDAAAKMNALVTEIEAITEKSWNIRLGVDDAEIEVANAALKVLVAQLDELVYKELPATTTATNRLWGVWRLLASEVALFGGAAKVAVWHIALDGIVEVLAVLVPAVVTLAADLTAFGVAGADAAIDVYNQFKALNTVATATGKIIPPMTGGLEKMQAAARPQVFQLLGDAISVMNDKSGLFAKIAFDTGGVIDRLAAKFVVFSKQGGQGLATFLRTGTSDLAAFSHILLNIGDAISHLVIVSEKTHIAEFLLQGLSVASDLFDLITKIPTPLLAVAFGLHAVYLWGGLATTILLKLATPFANLASAAGGISKTGRAVGQLTAESGPMERLGAIAGDLGNGLANIPGRIGDIGRGSAEAGVKVGALTRAGNLLTSVPITVWAGLAVGAMAYLGYRVINVNDSTKQLITTLQNQVLAQTSVTSGTKVLAAAQTDLVTRLSEVKGTVQGNTVQWDSLTNHIASQENVVAVTIRAWQNLARAFGLVHTPTQELQNAITKLNDQQQLSQYRLGALSKTYGGQATAMGLVSAAGITEKQWLDKSAEAWLIIKQQVSATKTAYVAMGQTGTTLGNDMEVLTQQADEQYKAIQTLNKGWDTFFTNVTGTQTSFDTFALGIQTLSHNFKSATAAAGETTHSFEGIKEKSGLAGAAMDGLNQASLTVNQAFATSVSNGNALVDSWRTAGLSGDLLAKGVRDIIAPMTHFATGSQEATAQLIALAEEAGYRGPNSMKTLQKWLGNTHDATQSLKDITDQATIQEALLTNAMNDQGKFIAGKLIGDINNAILSYDGVREAATKYGEAIARDGAQSDAAHKARQTLIQDIIDSGLAAHDSKDQIGAMISKVLGIPKKAAMQIIMTGTGSFTVKDLGGGRSITSTGTVRGVGGHTGAPGAADGMMVRGGTAGRDSVLINAMPGEVVVPTHMVKGGAVDHLRGHIPGFAGGGLVKNGNQSVLTGQYAVNEYNSFDKQFQASMIRSMTTAVKAAEKEAQAQAVMSGGISGNVRSYAPIVLAVLKMLGQPAGDLGIVLSQMSSESSGNPRAVNLTDSNAQKGTPSVGLMQVIGPTFQSYAGPFRNVGPFEYGTSINPEANIYAGLNYAIHAYPDWTAVLGHGHGYAHGTDGAAPGWAMVGEKGPELVKFHGGETVLPHSMSKAMGGMVQGYASGTKNKKHHRQKPLDERLENALHYTRKNRNEPARYTQVELHLEAVQRYMNNERTLVRFGHLKGGALARAKHGLRQDEREYKSVLKEIRPFTKDRGWVRSLRGSIGTQEKDLSKAIGVATNQGNHQLAQRLTSKMKWYTKTNKELGTWLDRLLPVAGPSKSGRKVSRQNSKDNAFIDSAITSAIRKAGLPMVPFNSYDKGGYLPTGLSLAYNGLGRPEKVGNQPIVVQFQVSNAHSPFDMFMTQWLQKAVQVKGGGDVQVAFGRVN